MNNLLVSVVLFFLFNLFTQTSDVTSGHNAQTISVNDEVAIVVTDNSKDDSTDATTSYVQRNFLQTFTHACFCTPTQHALKKSTKNSQPRAPPFLFENSLIS